MARVFERSKVNSEPEEEEGGLEGEDGDDEAEVAEKQTQAASKYFHVQKVARQDPRAAPLPGLLPAPGLAPHGQQAKEDHTKDASKTSTSVSVAGQPGWNLDEQLKQVSLSSWGLICSPERLAREGSWTARVCASLGLLSLLQ